MSEKAVRERCGTCGHKIRGKNHDEGDHHKRGKGKGKKK